MNKRLRWKAHKNQPRILCDGPRYQLRRERPARWCRLEYSLHCLRTKRAEINHCFILGSHTDYLVATAEEQVAGSSVVVGVDLSSSGFDLFTLVNGAQ